MSYYNVVQPCYVKGRGHYVSVPSQPITVDDEVAAPLVESGCLSPYLPGGVRASDVEKSFELRHPDAEPFVTAGEQAGEGASEVEDFAYGGPSAAPKPRSRSRRRTED